MAKFSDGSGRDWQLSLTVGSLTRLRTEAGFPINRATSGKQMSEMLFAEPETIGTVLWVLVRDQAAAAAVTREQFDDQLDEPTLSGAVDALMEAIVDFFHPRQAAAIKEKLPELVKRTEKEANEQLRKGMDSILNGTATSSPASSESTPSG